MSFILVAALVLQSLVSGVAGQMEGFPVCAVRVLTTTRLRRKCRLLTLF